MADYYRWNPGSERYIAPSGQFVSRAAVRATLDVVLEVQQNRVRTLTSGVVSGDVSLTDWRSGMVTALKTSHLEALAVARGGWAQVRQSDYEWAGGQRVRPQLTYLQKFHDDIASGIVPLNEASIASRAMMYIENGRGTNREAERLMGVERGATEERNQLGGSQDPCSECPALSDMGWVPIGSLPQVGARACLSRCKCWIATRTR